MNVVAYFSVFVADNLDYYVSNLPIQVLSVFIIFYACFGFLWQIMAQILRRMTCCCRDCSCCFWTALRRNSNAVGLWAGGCFSIIPHPSHQRNTLMHPFPFAGYPFTPYHHARKSVVLKCCFVNYTALHPLPSPLRKEIVYQEYAGLQRSSIRISPLFL